MSDARARTLNWVSRFVIAQSVCPFARAALPGLKIELSSAVATTEVISDVLAAALELDASDRELPATTLIVLEQGFSQFADFWEMSGAVEQFLNRSGFRGRLQVATFHPEYVFDGLEASDAANFTNRAPYPTLHLIRESDITRVMDESDDAERITSRNVRLMRELGVDALREILDPIDRGDA